MAYKFHYDGVNKKDQGHQKFRFTNTLDGTIYIINPDPKGPKVLEIPEASIKDVEQFFHSGSLMYPPEYPDALKRVKYIIHSGDVDGGSENYERVRASSNPMLPNRKSYGAIG